MFPDVLRISSFHRMNIKFVDTCCAYMDLQYNAWFGLQALCPAKHPVSMKHFRV